jgi:hypothetical protein
MCLYCIVTLSSIRSRPALYYSPRISPRIVLASFLSFYLYSGAVCVLYDYF